MPDKYTSTPLYPDVAYHIYNRANGSEQLFLNAENYRFFLEKYQNHLSPVLDTYCYCLMPNHFHFLVGIKKKEEIEMYFRSALALPKFKTLAKLTPPPLEKLISKQFANFFSSYTQAFNKLNNRKGSLFIKNFKRLPVKDDAYRMKLVHYIHMNPIQHGFCQKPENWKHSSYNTIISDQTGFIKKDKVIEWFEDLDNFIYCHQQHPEVTGIG